MRLLHSRPACYCASLLLCEGEGEGEKVFARPSAFKGGCQSGMWSSSVRRAAASERHHEDDGSTCTHLLRPLFCRSFSAAPLSGNNQKAKHGARDRRVRQGNCAGRCRCAASRGAITWAPLAQWLSLGVSCRRTRQAAGHLGAKSIAAALCLFVCGSLEAASTHLGGRFCGRKL